MSRKICLFWRGGGWSRKICLFRMGEGGVGILGGDLGGEGIFEGQFG